MIECAKIQSGNKEYLREIFMEWFPFTYKAVKRYYGKNAGNGTEKACEVIEKAIHKCVEQTNNHKEKDDFKKNIISVIVEEIKSNKAEYYISSTVNPNKKITETHTLFENYEIPDFSSITPEQLIHGLSELNPSKRLTFNLHELDGFSLEEIAALLEVSISTVKMNLEKARYEFQKNLEHPVKDLINGKNIQI